MRRPTYSDRRRLPATLRLGVAMLLTGAFAAIGATGASPATGTTTAPRNAGITQGTAGIKSFQLTGNARSSAPPALSGMMRWARESVFEANSTYSLDEYAAGVAVLGVAPGADPVAVATGLGVHVVTSDQRLNAVEVSGTAEVLAGLAAHVGEDPLLRYVEPTRPMHLDHARSDPGTTVVDSSTGQTYEWPFKALHVDRALNLTRGSADILVGIVDTGYSNVPDLRGKIAKAWYFSNESRDAYDTLGHGTFVASLIAANNDDRVGLAGFCGACRLDVFKVVNLYDFAIAIAIRRLVDDHVRIINLSLGSETGSYVMLDAVNYAISNGVLVVAASGNNGSGLVDYPAAWLAGDYGARGWGLAVGASDFNGNRARFSQWGRRLSLFAPGTFDGHNCSIGVWGAIPPVSTEFDNGTLCAKTFTDPNGNRNAYASGTSFSAPEVAGIAALVWAARPGLKNYEVAALLEQTADRPAGGGWQLDRGWGLVNAAAAVERATGRSSTDVVSLTGTHAVGPAVARHRVTVAANATWADSVSVGTGQIACQATIGTRQLVATQRSLTNGLVMCTWLIPASASGKTIHGTMTATDIDRDAGVAHFKLKVRRANRQ
jgi:subtilisin family serine protease